MTRDQFLSRLRRYCRKSSLDLRIQEERGKGSHMRIFVGDKATTVQQGELSPRHVERLLRQLGLPKDTLN